MLKHLSRQGLRLPDEVKAAAGISAGSAPVQDNRNRRGNNQPQAPEVSPKEALADDLYWEEQATAELLAIAASVVPQSADPNPQSAIDTLAEKFAGREERLQARTSLFRARILEARTAFWQGTQAKIADIVGTEPMAPYAEMFADLDAEQEAMISLITAQDEDRNAPVKVKPDEVGQFMRQRDELERTAFNELMNDLRAEDRAAYDRLKALQEEHKKEQRKDEQRVLDELIPKRSPPSGRRRAAPLACAPTTCSSWAASPSTKARSPR